MDICGYYVHTNLAGLRQMIDLDSALNFEKLVLCWEMDGNNVVKIMS